MAEEMKTPFLPQEEEAFVPTRRDYAGELFELLHSGRPLAELRELLDDYHDGDLADVLEQLGESERKRLYRVLTPLPLPLSLRCLHTVSLPCCPRYLLVTS